MKFLKETPVTVRWIFILGSLFYLVSCGENHSSKNIFRINQTAGVESLDPAFAKNLNIMWHTNNLYNRLLEYDEQMNVKPSLAKSWRTSPDGKTYTFILRKDVYFQDNDIFPNGKGRKLTAYDVEYSFKRIIDAGVASPGAWIFNGSVDTTEPFKAINDSVFILRLRKPYNPILGIISMQYCGIVAKEVVEKWGEDYRSHPCGTGPFQMKDWEEGVTITYIRNPHYWERDTEGRRLPYLEGIKTTFIDSKATEFLMFMQGELDFMNGIDATFKDQVLNKKGELKKEFSRDIVLKKHPYLNVEYLGVLQDAERNSNKVLLNKKIRQAMNYGFDRRKLITYLRNNIGTAAEQGMIPPGVAGFDSSLAGYTYQPEKAKQLIDEAKRELKGEKLQVTLLTPDNYVDRCSFIASQLKEIGLDIRLEIMQPNLLREQMSNSKADFFWATWIADYPDAESYLTLFYSRNTAPPNYTRFKNSAFDELYEQALSIPDQNKKLEMYKAMDKIIVSEAPCVPLFYDELIHFIHTNIKGFKTNSLNLMEWKEIRKMEE